MTRSGTVNLNGMLQQSIEVITRPSVATFERHERSGAMRDALVYVLVAAVISAVVAFLFALLPFHHVSAGGQFVQRLITVPLTFFAFVYAVYLIGKNFFQGTGRIDEVAYTFALFFVPISIVTTIVGALVPPLGWLLTLLNVYFGWLAVQSSMNIYDQGRAIVVLVLAWVALTIVNIIIGSIFAALFLSSALVSGALGR